MFFSPTSSLRKQLLQHTMNSKIMDNCNMIRFYSSNAMQYESTAMESNTLTTNVCESYLITCLHWTTLFDWYMTTTSSEK